MAYEDLLNSGRIRRQKVSRDEIARALQRSARDLKTARIIMAEDWDWGFAVAYNSVLQASRGYMFSRGYRPSSGEGHKNTFAFMAEAMGPEYEEMIAYFDRMRNKRNRALYDVAGIITESEARNLFAQAQNFVTLIRKRLEDEGYLAKTKNGRK